MISNAKYTSQPDSKIVTGDFSKVKGQRFLVLTFHVSVFRSIW